MSIPIDLETVFDAYQVCAEWSSTHTPDPEADANQPVPMDEVENNGWADEARRESKADIAAFCETCALDLAEMDPVQIGHDFWLTRNGHGAGFWDRGLGERGRRLTDACRPYGKVDLYLGDDGFLHI